MKWATALSIMISLFAALVSTAVAIRFWSRPPYESGGRLRSMKPVCIANGYMAVLNYAVAFLISIDRRPSPWVMAAAVLPMIIYCVVDMRRINRELRASDQRIAEIRKRLDNLLK